ncbi:DUF3883 domain-containing protein [Planococcus sp. MERTA32b]|nr:DUF3883 domain-containing protein [Planococcus sp. MER TA 32b]
MIIIDKLQKQFLLEAKNSPILLSDLASMETYIAESYQERSIIELLQNADDALSSRFLIKKINNTIIVANDGREFSEEDITAVCRSGASTKKRGSTTIGYRGIGFKSVVNLADRVHILSKDIGLTFSRELTNELLEERIKVPLIRIPHTYSPFQDHTALISELFEQNYTTIFIFEELKRDNLESEIEYFDSSSLLFLKKIKQLEFDANIEKLISVKRKIDGEQEILSVTEDGIKENWLVCREESNKIEAIAFLLDENMKIEAVDSSRSVAHSFMPTKDSVGLPIKINGDFSTDPSRTKVVFDDATFHSIEICCKLLVKTIKSQFRKQEFSGLFDVLSEKNESIYSRFSQTQKFKEYFINKFNSILNVDQWFIDDDNNAYTTHELKVNPLWLNKEDFLSITKRTRYFPIDKNYESRFPGLLKFAESYGTAQLTLEEVLEGSKSHNPTINGGVEILTESVKKYRFQLNSEIKELLKSAKFLFFESKEFLSINQLEGGEIIDKVFLEKLNIKINDKNDLEHFIKNLDMPIPINLLTEIKVTYGKDIESSNNIIAKFNTEQKTVIRNEKLRDNESKYSNSLKKWRNVETNLARFLEMDESVDKVLDVSKSNLGYDLEVYRGNDIEYIEVKSVDSMGATISMTNNEYSTANELKDKFILAIAKQTTDNLEVCFIKNPIYNLNLTKRVTRWEWICDEYSGKVNHFEF